MMFFSIFEYNVIYCSMTFSKSFRKSHDSKNVTDINAILNYSVKITVELSHNKAQAVVSRYMNACLS